MCCLLDSGAFGRKNIRCKWGGGGRMSVTKLGSASGFWLDVADASVLCDSLLAGVQRQDKISRILTYCYFVGLYTFLHSAESQQVIQLWQADLSSQEA